MANKRDLKKEIKNATDQLIEDAFYQTLDAADKEAKKMDELIDQIVDERFELINKVNQYPLNQKRADVKAHFEAIRKDLDKVVGDFSKKIGKVD